MRPSAAQPAQRPPGIGAVITESRACGTCGYDLKGLKTGGRCPECGTPITAHRSSGRFGDNLCDAPIGYLRHLRLAQGLIAFVALSGMGVVGLIWFGRMQFALLPISMMALTPIWALAIWMTTARRPAGLPRDAVLDNVKLRTVLRAAQSVPVLAAACTLAGWLLQRGVVGGMPVIAQVAFLTALALVVFSILTLVPLGVFLSALCDWAGDGPLSNRFRVVASVITVAGLLCVLMTGLAVLSPTARGLAALVLMWSLIFTMLSTTAFLVFLLQLAHLTHWAVVNALDAEDRELRVAERRARRVDELAARAPAPPVASPSMPLAPPRNLDPIPLAGEDAEDLPGLPKWR